MGGEMVSMWGRCMLGGGGDRNRRKGEGEGEGGQGKKWGVKGHNTTWRRRKGVGKRNKIKKRKGSCPRGKRTTQPRTRGGLCTGKEGERVEEEREREEGEGERKEV